MLSIPHKGTCVKVLPRGLAGREIRAVLEGYVVYRLLRDHPGSTAGTSSLNAEAQPLLQRELRGGRRANTRFHESIWEASGKRRLMTTLWTMRDHLQAMRARVFAIEGQAEVGFREHTRILGALEAHDAQLAHELLSRHIFALVEPLRWTEPMAASAGASATAGASAIADVGNLVAVGTASR